MRLPLHRLALAASALALLLGAAAPASAEASSAPASHTLPTHTRFYVDPDSDAAHQAVTDFLHRDFEGAKSMAKLAGWPEAAWFTDGTPKQVESRVRDLVHRAERTRTVPLLVAYNIPLRDCSQYSSGGAQSDAEYQAWISAFARGLGRSKAVVILEPDGLANLPSDCGPGSDPTGAITTGRFAAWVSQCLWFATKGPDWARGHADWCASQYYSPAAPNDGQPGNSVNVDDPSTWHWTDRWFQRNVGTPPTQE
ncbi:glycoside hydrolase family 6 protein, partial [Streptomyces sp. NPDC059956]